MLANCIASVNTARFRGYKLKRLKRVRIEFRVGEVEFSGVSFELFEDFPAFSSEWSERVVPGRQLLSSWDHVSQNWSSPVGRKKLRIAPGVQCLCLNSFGQRDTAAEAAMMARVLRGLGADLPVLKAALADTLPPSVFAFDASQAVPQAALHADSWQVFGQARFDHFVLRFPAGRVTDWALLSVATDFVLSRRRIGQRLPAAATPSGAGDGTLAERVFDMMSGTRQARGSDRPH
jgi:hypothetical protein